MVFWGFDVVCVVGGYSSFGGTCTHHLEGLNEKSIDAATHRNLTAWSPCCDLEDHNLDIDLRENFRSHQYRCILANNIGVGGIDHGNSDLSNQVIKRG
jgi:hypothetical protein